MVESLGHYKILGRVGAGGLGDLYRGRDAPRGRTVTIEVLPDSLSADPDRRPGFMREAEASKVLSHPNIAALHEVADDRGRLFLVFDAVPAQTLQAAIGGQPMNLRRALDIGLQIADALAEAHARQIFHRYLRPASVIITPQGHAKVLDFAMAAWLDDQGMTREQFVYLSPEQLHGDLLDERTDVFSLGVVLFEMITGTAPPASRSLPPELDGILTRAIARDRADRYQSIAGLAGDLRLVAGQLEARRAAGERRR